MKSQPVRILYLLIAHLFVTVVRANGLPQKLTTLDYGLKFRSHQYNQDERTALDLTPDRPFRFGSQFSLSFDLRLTREDLAFGYVFRIVSGGNSSLDMTANYNTNKINFILTREHNTIANLDFHNDLQLCEERWMHVSVEFDPKGITCRMDSVSHRVSQPIADPRNVRIFFGRNRHGNYYTTDVPPMTLRNVALCNKKCDTIAFWQLARHNLNEVYDAVHRRRAMVRNGNWEIDRHTRWERIERWSLREKNAQIALDRVTSRMFAATSDSVFVYDFDDSSLERFPVEGGGSPFQSGGSQLIYDPLRNRLISYSILFDSFIEYDFETHRWSDRKSEGLPPVQHHSRLVDVRKRQLIVFGGYGNHTYHAELAVHDLDGGIWRKDTLSSRIRPRYLCSMGFAGADKVLIMGGYGSESGKQEESPCNYYDIHEVNLKTHDTRKIGDFSSGRESIVLGNTMVVDTIAERCYTLAYRNDRFTSELSLLSYDLRNHTTTVYGDSIPFRFLDMESYADLMFHKSQSRLYAVVMQAHQSGRYDLEVYLLSFPPLHAVTIRQTPPVHASRLYIWLFGLLAAGSTAWIVLRGRKRKRKRAKSTADFHPADTAPSSPPADNACRRSIPGSISLLGGLQILNREGIDITANFTPITRQIFILILLNSAEEGKGTTSQMLDETFWLGMDKEKASNNRNVNIRKLRLRLQEIGDIALTYNNGYWNLKVGSEIRCDYMELLPLLKRLQTQPVPDRQVVERALVLAKGLLLPNTTQEWTDAYKDRYSNLVIDTLLSIARNPSCEQDDALMLSIVKTILVHDCIDEDAMRIQCRILNRKGQKGQSKQAFDKYCADYEKLLGTAPDITYEEVIGGKTG